jgi:hypothetical protein
LLALARTLAALSCSSAASTLIGLALKMPFTAVGMTGRQPAMRVPAYPAVTFWSPEALARGQLGTDNATPPSKSYIPIYSQTAFLRLRLHPKLCCQLVMP